MKIPVFDYFLNSAIWHYQLYRVVALSTHHTAVHCLMFTILLNLDLNFGAVHPLKLTQNQKAHLSEISVRTPLMIPFCLDGTILKFGGVGPPNIVSPITFALKIGLETSIEHQFKTSSECFKII